MVNLGSDRAAAVARRLRNRQNVAGQFFIHDISPSREQVGQTLQEYRHVAPIAVVMGVSGSGKSTVARALAQRLGWYYEEGDRLHPPANVAKMSAGHPLDDDDRTPWLSAIAARIDERRRRGEPAVITCSALRRRYREIVIGRREGVSLVYLDGSRELIAGRLAGRHGHFMPAALLDSQFTALEPPGPDERPITVSIDQPPDRIVDCLVTALSPAEATLAAEATLV